MEQLEKMYMDKHKNRRSILLIDDNAEFLEAEAVILRRFGAPIVPMTSSSQALWELKQHPDHYALAIIDLEMPGDLDGIETIRRIKDVSTVRVAILSAHLRESQWQARLRALNTDIAAFEKPLPLPCSPAFAEFRNTVTSALNAPSILLIDNDVGQLDSTAALLRPLGIGLVKARTGDEGLAILLADPSSIALALIDLNMPGSMNGIETIKAIRKHSTIPVMLLTGFYGGNMWEEDIQRMAANVQVLQKPLPLRLSPRFEEIKNRILDSYGIGAKMIAGVS
jgi:CheY-like chemotaxis protein